jgi:16S rRNA (adenine1518-N6/adenine1519-N6)-dimethyltransferase
MIGQKQTVPRKSLGQNFLRNLSVVRRIVESLELSPRDRLLEIGCGTGVLTREVLDKTNLFIGVEIDRALCAQLEQEFQGEGLFFLCRDFLELDWGELPEIPAGQAALKVVGNLPYYVTSPILEKLCRWSASLERAVLMMQAEVADRLCASPGCKEYGVLTVLTGCYFQLEEVMKVPPSAFFPRPKVTSTVVRLIPRPRRLLVEGEDRRFEQLVKQSFSQRRKTLSNCLKGWPGYQPERLLSWLRSCGFPPDVRAERLSLPEFLELTRLFGD